MPLADSVRPKTLDEVVGQKHILGKGRPLRNIIEGGHIPNMIFYGSSGIGKTTVANIIADVIITLAGQIGQFLQPGSPFICSGIIRDREQDVEQALQQNGFTLLEKRQKKDWTAYLTRLGGDENA